MKTITICKSREGLLVVHGELGFTEEPKKLMDRSYAFNNLVSALATIRSILKGWQESEPSALATLQELQQKHKS